MRARNAFLTNEVHTHSRGAKSNPQQRKQRNSSKLHCWWERDEWGWSLRESLEERQRHRKRIGHATATRPIDTVSSIPRPKKSETSVLNPRQRCSVISFPYKLHHALFTSPSPIPSHSSSLTSSCNRICFPLSSLSSRVNESQVSTLWGTDSCCHEFAVHSLRRTCLFFWVEVV